VAAIALPVLVAGCAPQDPPAAIRSNTTLTVGLGSAPGEGSGAGIQSTVRLIALETLVAYSATSRPEQRLAEEWKSAQGGLTWHVKLRPNIRFHDGERLEASDVRDVLMRDLPEHMGPAFDDIREIVATSTDTLEFRLKRPSTFLMDSLDVPIQKPTKPGQPLIGTGPFQMKGPLDGQEVEMVANEAYYAGRPPIDRIVLRRYPSIRAAWADMLRDRVDMLYEVGLDAIDLIQPSRNTKLFAFQRPYAYTVILNTRSGVLKNPALRRGLNAAVDRVNLIAQALQGHGVPADGPVWPHHWAFSGSAPKFEYRPAPLPPVEFRCVFVERSHERIALALQQQLQEVGVRLVIEQLPVDTGLDRLRSGNFDAFLIDVANGPLARPYLFWHTSGPFNYARYSNLSVDAALSRIQHALDDTEYRAAVAAFQDAIVADPPAIFLAWSERARAVSTRFEVPAEPGRDILSTLRSWRPAADNPKDSVN
jgi:peptide/nickel transport system substrate-binding protein